MRKDYDFSKAKKASEVPHLKKLQDTGKGKTRITIMLDNDILSYFRDRSEKEGAGYQTLINQELRKNFADGALNDKLDEKKLRQILREEFAKYSTDSQ
tara:strand:- start:1118 stop:1411 length:294 start_codon:yes stop_codon:yes gene_type:complete